jgi:hypothetical protein
LGSGSQVPILAEEAVFAGDGDQITVVVIVDIMVMVQLRISVLQILLQVHSLDNREIGSPMAQVSTLGSKATGLGVLTTPSNVNYAMIMGILPNSVLNYLLIMYKLMPI